MLEFVSVPYPPIAPQACVCCAGATGPMADTHRELAGHGRIYVCASCWERVGRALGTLRGKQRNELLRNQREIADARIAVEQATSAQHQAEQERDTNRERYENAERDRDEALQRVEQLTQRLAEHAKADLELIGAAGGGAD